MDTAGDLERLLCLDLAADEQAEKGRDLRLHPGLGPELRQSHDQRRRLHEGVVGDARHRGMAAAAVDAQPERRTHLLGGRAEVEDAPLAEVDPVARAFVDAVLGTDRVRVLAAEPGEAEVFADLLVGGGGEDQVAARLEPLA